MTQEKTPGQAPCVPVFDTAAQCPRGELIGAKEVQPPVSNSAPTIPAEIPRTRSPYDVWHPEAYLIRALVKLHGWRVIEPGVIRRGGRR